MPRFAVLILALMPTAICGCVNYYVTEPINPLTDAERSDSVYVVNPDLSREYELLRASGLYELTSDPDSPRQMRLMKIWEGEACGNGALVTLFTLGLIPFIQSTNEIFAYELTEHGKTRRYEHYPRVHSRSSLWELFLKPFSLSHDEALQRALRSSTRRQIGIEAAIDEDAP